MLQHQIYCLQPAYILLEFIKMINYLFFKNKVLHELSIWKTLEKRQSEKKLLGKISTKRWKLSRKTYKEEEGIKHLGDTGSFHHTHLLNRQ